MLFQGREARRRGRWREAAKARATKAATRREENGSRMGDEFLNKVASLEFHVLRIEEMRRKFSYVVAEAQIQFHFLAPKLEVDDASLLAGEE